MKLWNKFLVVRRDGTVPDWPWLVMGSRDPYAPAGLRAYADAAEVGVDEAPPADPEYVADLRQLADEWDEYRHTHGLGDPDAPPHREDDPAVVGRIPMFGGTIGHRKL